MSIGIPACSTLSCRTGPFHALRPSVYPRIFKPRQTTSSTRRSNKETSSADNPIEMRRSRGAEPHQVLGCVIRIDANVALGQVAGPNARRCGTRVQHDAYLNLFFTQFLLCLFESGVRDQDAADVDIDSIRL